MSAIDKFSCCDCGFEIDTYQFELFFYNPQSNQTADYLLLMSSAGKDDGYETKGHVSRSYCRHCDKYVKIYFISDGGGADAIKNVRQGISNYLDALAVKLHENEYVKVKESLMGEFDYIRVVVDASDNSLIETVRCPECDNEILAFVNEDTPCPKCGGKLVCTETILCD